MKTKVFKIAAGLSLAAVGLMGQGRGIVPPTGENFQDAGAMGVLAPVRISLSAVVTGSPVSAQEVTRTTQTLSDGTEIENTRTALFYRDNQGRTRTEPPDSGGRAVIIDPVAGFRITLNASAKTAERVPLPAGAGGGRSLAPPSGTAPMGAGLTAAAEGRLQRLQSPSPTLQARAGGKPQPTTEDLGVQTQNGVAAQGTRSTVTIPKGQIGNNRDIHVVNERWYSKDLQMLVKSVNSDPRFGVTTYDLTNITQSADPTLFQIPEGYTVTDFPGGRGGRGGTIK